MIHPTAIIHPSAEIDPDAEIGPYVVIDGPAKISSACQILAHAQIVGSVTIGSGSIIGRGAIIGEQPQDLGFDPATVSGVRIGERCTLREHVTIHRGSKPDSQTSIGNDNFLMAGSHLGHDVQLGNQNIIANAALLAGHVVVGNQTFIGGGAVFHQFIRIGDNCVIQGNGSFSKDIPHFCSAQRINRIVGLNVIGLRRQGFSGDERREIKDLFHQLFTAGLNLSQAIAEAGKHPWSPRAKQLLEFVMAPSRKGICAVRPGKDDE